MTKKRDDWGELQERMTRTVIREMRNDLEDISRVSTLGRSPTS